MDPPSRRRPSAARRLPRTRGDGPFRARQDADSGAASPHTRGWTRRADRRGDRDRGFPAHAGMDPTPRGAVSGFRRLPRTRGDGPAARSRSSSAIPASPHTRGWTRAAHPDDGPPRGFPAHAGMDPIASCPRPRSVRLPRTRGDGPVAGVIVASSGRASPHTRGWTRRHDDRLLNQAGFPAHAGMDLVPRFAPRVPLRLPRTRGDGPRWTRTVAAAGMASPHTRGWTVPFPTQGDPPAGFPAHAGMDPRSRGARRRGAGLPRTRGDGPCRFPRGVTHPRASPHTRGWTRPRGGADRRERGFPAHAGMDPGGRRGRRMRDGLPRTRGDGPLTFRFRPGRGRASPHTRGWTVRVLRRGDGVRGFPAHAGMDPAGCGRTATPGRLPRTRGDGPDPPLAAAGRDPASPHTRGWTRPRPGEHHLARGFPAHAGMDPRPTSRRCRSARLPRTRGDGPRSAAAASGPKVASPHTRGWTRGAVEAEPARRGFPAHAGMDPERPGRGPWATWLPRTRGDGPLGGQARQARQARLRASPHTRGWTLSGLIPRQPARGFPAHAGMDPRTASLQAPPGWLPRTRGDGPSARPASAAAASASPHTRGWTPLVQRRRADDDGFPAHAGMDPAGTCRRHRGRGLPRTRGDGPPRTGPATGRPRASPHTRGWTRAMRRA